MTVTPLSPGYIFNATEDESDLVSELLFRLSQHQQANATKLAYYLGEQVTEQLGIAIPPGLATVELAAGWSGTTVDVLEERLDWYGWRTDGDDFGLGEVYAGNALDVEAGRAHLDALIYGTAFAVVGTGEPGEPSPLVTLHSPAGMTGLWDARSRRLRAALSLTPLPRGEQEARLYLPDQTVVMTRPVNGGRWTVVDRDQHRLGRVPVVQFENRARNGVRGRSEITRAVRYYTDAAVRTLLAMEIHREFYQAPQRYALGVDESDFIDASGNVRSGWETIMGRVWALNRDDDGNLPEVGQFSPASPTPYLDQVRGLAQMLAAEAGIPSTYLGFQTDNPASADAIRAAEARLIKRAERRQVVFGRSWLEVGRLALLVRDRAVPDGFAVVANQWRDAATPTRAATADETSKYIAAGVLPPDSQVTYDRMGLSPAEQRQLAADRRRATGTSVLQALTEAANRAVAPTATTDTSGDTGPAA